MSEKFGDFGFFGFYASGCGERVLDVKSVAPRGIQE